MTAVARYAAVLTLALAATGCGRAEVTSLSSPRSSSAVPSTTAPEAASSPRTARPPLRSVTGRPVATAPVDRHDPRDVARGWTLAAHTLSWRDPGPSAWLDRALPLATPALARRLGALRGGGGGGTWALLQAERCDVAPRDIQVALDGTVSDQVTAVVTAQLVTRCATGTVQLAPLRLTVRLVGSRGGWLVADTAHF